MASKSKFNIPSLDEMTGSGVDKPAVRSLFQSHKAEKQSTTTVKPATSSVPTKQAVPSSSSITNSTYVPSRTSASNAAHSVSNKPPGGSSSNGNQASSSESHSHRTSAESVSKTASPLKSNAAPSGVPLTPTKPGSKTISLIVNPRQRGNPILKAVRSVPWEFGDIVPDYELGQTTCALFLSLRYHHLNPEYIHQRLKQLAHSYELRVLLVQVDVKDPHHSLKELAKMCILADCTLILAFSPEEAGRYLETYKAFENKPPDLIKERTESNFLAKMTDVLTSVKKVNKTDASTLLSTFGTVADIVKASEEDLSLCPGFGPQKARRLHEIMHEPFLKKNKILASPVKQASRPGTPKKTPSKKTGAANSSSGKETPLKQSLLSLSPGPRKRIAHKAKDEDDDDTS